MIPRTGDRTISRLAQNQYARRTRRFSRLCLELAVCALPQPDPEFTEWAVTRIPRRFGVQEQIMPNLTDTTSAELSNLLDGSDSSIADGVRTSVSQLRPPIRGGLPPRVLRRVREFIEANLERNLSIKVLAATAGLSIYHFARAFKQSLGRPPHDYVVQCRVRRVQHFLADTDLPLSEIALASGFSDPSHCVRRFRERVGITPNHYRWLMR
jgi:AraC-like DNA-binding protein